MHGVVLRARAAWPPTIGPYRDLLVAAVNVCRAEVDTAGGAGILNSIPKTEMFHGNFPEMGQKATGPTRSGPVGKMFIIWMFRTQGRCRYSGAALSSSTRLGIIVMRAL